MSDKFYAVRYQSMPSEMPMLAIFSLEEKAKNYAIYLLETEWVGGNIDLGFKFELGNFVAIIPTDPNNLPREYEGVELLYVNNVIPKV